MALSQTSTLEAHQVSQFSLFMANKVGRLLEIVRLLAATNTHIVALSVVDTADSAIARMVVDDPDAARRLFLEHNIEYTECQLVVVKMTNNETDLQKILSSLLMGEINIFFIYSFLVHPYDNTALGLHVEDHEVACNVLTQNGFTLLSQKDISR